MRIAILLLLLVLLIGGAGGAAWWFLLREPDGEAEVVEEPVIESGFVEFMPMILPIIERGRITNHVAMIVTIEIPQGESLDRAELYKPKLRDMLFSELHALYALRYVTDRGYDDDIVKERLTAVAAKVVGKDIIRGIELEEGDFN